MNTATEIMQAYRDGNISEAECWEQLKIIRAPKPHDEPDLTTPPSKVYEPLNKYELKAIEYLQRVSFGASNSMKRFAHQVKDAKELTGRQREYLRLLVWKYRRQIFKHFDKDKSAKAFIEAMKATQL